MKIATDGGNRPHTVPGLIAIGANTVVLGSLAYSSEDLKNTMEWLQGLPTPAAYIL